MLHRGKRGGHGRPPLTRGGGRPLTTTGNNNNNARSEEDSSIDTPPRSPSEGSVGSQGATLQQVSGSAILSPTHSQPPSANNNTRIETVSELLHIAQIHNCGNMSENNRDQFHLDALY